MKTMKSDKTLLSWKRLAFYVACVATLGLLSCLTLQARDYDKSYPHEAFATSLLFEEPQPIFEGQTNYLDYRLKLVNIIVWNRIKLNYVPMYKPENWKPVSVDPRIELEEWMINTKKWGVEQTTGER